MKWKRIEWENMQILKCVFYMQIINTLKSSSSDMFCFFEMPDLSHIGDLHHSSQQHWILNPLTKNKDWICVLIDTSQIRFY